MKTPAIVAIEGLDSCGKSLHQKILADYFDDRWVIEGELRHRDTTDMCIRRSFPDVTTETGAAILTRLKGFWGVDGQVFATPLHGRLPEDEETSEEAKDREQCKSHLDALVLQALFTANRLEAIDDLERIVNIERQNIVLSRFWASAVAYGAADGLDPVWLEKIHSRMPKAHHVLIDIPVEESFKRRPERLDKYESSRPRLAKARDAYLALFERKLLVEAWPRNKGPEYRTTGGDAESWSIVNGLGTPEEVQGRIRQALGL